MEGWGRRGAGTGQFRRAEAPGRDRIVSRLKADHCRICRTSHQKCFVLGSRRENEMDRTNVGAGLGVVKKFMSEVEGVGSGLDAKLKGEEALDGKPYMNCSG